MEKRNNRYLLGGVSALVLIALAACDSGDAPQQQTSATAGTTQQESTADAASAQMTTEAPEATGTATADDGIYWGEITYGAADAPVTIIEYASMTCPHCAAFHASAFQELKRDYIDTGKVKLHFREYPLDQRALLASMLARCAGEEKAPRFIEALFKQQRSWALAPDPQAGLAQVARFGGMSQAKFEACMNNQELARLIAESRQKGNDEFNISATPTIIVNGESRREFLSYEELDKYLQNILS